MQFWLIFILVSGVSVWLSVLTFIFIKQTKHYRQLIKNTKNQNLQDILDNIYTNQQRLSREIKKNSLKIATIEHDTQYHLQKIGFNRFNPFNDTGGDQSFALSFLDNKKNGIVFTFLHSRDTTRVYAKQVIKGKSDKFPLSKEEEEVIDSAVSSTL
ncbi:hypothetical protein COX08_00070 [Candidatus Beckwithbacteria bacterium CG23_combo_of_CG06-09_8_20_14_all_34_8]|uniref:DUF4446 domain-containing protein n=1 Tax=Candidatus Beckwithbacteria bacterium CG23_combo_of_CG06-09_8_20_14_all_34_8 TaxID=1974497 RepID=A0A2H0B7K5_9BACT|nr:MAG: hypothetical protein COX08_00070 [Candidatus Beckwithbacteria bacterium CG23_combo_of_CG06-09_8_20_14_all_34_8]